MLRKSPVAAGQTPALYLLLHYLLLAIDGSKRLEASRCVGWLQLGAAGAESQAREIPPSLCCTSVVPSAKGEGTRGAGHLLALIQESPAEQV